MERVLPMPNETIGGVPHLHHTIRPLQSNFPDRISQLISGVHNTSSTAVATSNEAGGTSLNVTERARTGLALAMDLIRMPNAENLTHHKEHATNNNGTPTCSPTVTSTPGAYSRQSSGFNVSPSCYADLDSNGTARPESMTDTAMPPKKLTSDDIPVLDSFPGYFGFDLYRPLCGDAYEAAETKPSTAFFYFKDEQGWTNLYAKKTPTWWTLSYWCQRQPPEGSFIRLTPVYGTSDKQQEVIQRCFEDFMAMPTNSMSRYSIVVVGNSLADYFFDPITERLCVTLPYERPKEGCEYSQFNGKFMCFNSCLYNGGQGNKKPLFLIITLERLVAGTEPNKGQCEVLGRQCIKFRSCACPKRDKENSERRTGDVTSFNVQRQGKRKKDSDRLDRHSKKLRSHNHDFHTSNKTTRQLNNRWGSPGQETFGLETHSSSIEDGLDPRHGELFGDSEVRQPMINVNGESYHLLLVPTDLPGGIDTLAGVRFGLIRTWLHSPSNSGGKQTAVALEQSVLKQEMDAEKKILTKTNNSEGTYTNLLNTRTVVDNTLQQLTAVESQLAHFLRERILLLGQYQNAYHYSGESTDSQPNSTGAVALGIGSLDESVNQTHEFPPTCTIGPLSSDSGISTDPTPQQCTSLGLVQQTQLINGMFSGPPAAHRSSIYAAGSSDPSQVSPYDLEYGTRFQNHSTTQLYLPHASGDLRNAIGSSYPSELLENYAIAQQASASTSDAVSSEQRSSARSSRPSVSRSDPGTAVSGAVSSTLSLNLNHALNSSAFYPTQYFVNRPNSSEQTSNLLENFPHAGGHIGASQTAAMSGGGQTNVYFYPSIGSGTLPESILLPEDILTTYSDRVKGYDETDGTNHSSIAHHPPRLSPCYSSSSPRSPNSVCCEKLIILDV